MEKPPASGSHSSLSTCCSIYCKCGIQGSGIHFLSSQILSRSSRKRFDIMSRGATKMPGCGPGIFDIRPKRNPAPSGAAFFYPRASRCPQGLPGEDPLPLRIYFRTRPIGKPISGQNTGLREGCPYVLDYHIVPYLVAAGLMFSHGVCGYVFCNILTINMLP